MNNEVTTTAPTEQEAKDLQLVTGSLELIQQLPAKLQKHQTTLARAKQAQQAQIDKIGAHGNKLNEELDNETKELIIKLRKSTDAREEDRKPITQLFTAIAKMFTGVEGELKALINPLQVYRDDYAKWCHEEAERKQREAERKAKVENARTELRSSITQLIGTKLNEYLYSIKAKMQSGFNAITLENYDAKSTGLANMHTAFDRTKLGEVLRYDLPNYDAHLLSIEDANKARIDAHEAYDFNSWFIAYHQEITDLKKELQDKLPSKKAELDAAAAAEAERQRIAKEQAEAEEKRQAAIAAANAEQKQKLEAEAAAQRAADAKRLADMQAEQARIDAERKQREAEEAAELQRQKEAADKKAKEDAEISAAAAKAQTLFDAAIDATPDNAAPEARTGYEITVLHQAGWVEIFQLWYQNEGVKLGVEEMGKKSLNSMKTWAENHAKKNDEKLSSKYLKYEASVKAINRK